MKKIIMFSDAHGDNDRVKRLIEEYPDVDYFFFLGDGLKGVLDCFDTETFKKLYYVEGNCDSYDTKDNYAVIEGKAFLLTHGNKYKVKYDKYTLMYRAEELQVHCACFGHTHQVYQERVGGIWYLNPGALYKGSYMLITIENGIITPVTMYMD